MGPLESGPNARLGKFILVRVHRGTATLESWLVSAEIGNSQQMIDPNQFGFEESSDTHVGGPSALQKAGGKLFDRRGVSWLEAPQWQPQSCFWHGFSTRSAEVAEFNLGFTHRKQ